jgi:hypothetical protein
MLEFTEDGIKYTADKGWARADDLKKKGVCRWEAQRVFVKEKPTKEKVIALHKDFLKGLEA